MPIFLDLSICERDIFWLRLLWFGPKDCQKDFKCSAYSKYLSAWFWPTCRGFSISCIWLLWPPMPYFELKQSL